MEVRAIYENGVLRLIDPLELQEGQQVKLTIQADIDVDITARLVVADLLAELPDSFEELELDEAELNRLGKLFALEQPVEDTIDEDRGEF